MVNGNRKIKVTLEQKFTQEQLMALIAQLDKEIKEEESIITRKINRIEKAIAIKEKICAEKKKLRDTYKNALPK